MNQGNDIHRGFQSLPCFHPLQRFDSGCPSDTDKAPKWSRHSATEPVSKQNVIWGSRKTNAPLLDNSSSSGRSYSLSSRLAQAAMDNSSTRSYMGRTVQSDPGARRFKDFIPATPMRSSSFQEDPCPLPGMPSTNASRWAANVTRSNNPNKRRTTRSSRRHKNHGTTTSTTTTTCTSTTTTSRRNRSSKSKSKDHHSEATMRLAEEIIGVLQRVMVDDASADEEEQSFNNNPALGQSLGNLNFSMIREEEPTTSSNNNGVTCSKCLLDVYTVSSCRYVQCPRCDALNLLKEDDPLPVGVGLTFDGLEKILDPGHPTLMQAAKAAYQKQQQQRQPPLQA